MRSVHVKVADVLKSSWVQHAEHIWPSKANVFLASSCWSAVSRVMHKVQPNTSELHKSCESVCIRAHQIISTKHL